MFLKKNSYAQEKKNSNIVIFFSKIYIYFNT